MAWKRSVVRMIVTVVEPLARWHRQGQIMLFPPRTDCPRQRVVVTGAGIVTALGVGWRVNADGFRIGRAAFRPVTLFEVARQRAKVAGEVSLPPSLPPTRLGLRTQRRLTRASRLLLWAAAEAWRQADWAPDGPVAQVLGTTNCGAESAASRKGP